jgi:RNA polymerase sigma factor (sigma-70 family)
VTGLGTSTFLPFTRGLLPDRSLNELGQSTHQECQDWCATCVGASGHNSGVECSDSDLWARSRAGDAKAFGQLFDRHAQLIYKYCFLRIGDRSNAQDLLSIVFLEAWRRKDKELPPDKVLPWLYGIATNVVRHQRCSERRYADALRRLPEVTPEPDFSGAADERLDDERRFRRAVGLLETLSHGERDVFVLCVGMALSYEDAAVALDIPVGTVRSRLSRARSRIARELDRGCGHKRDETTNVTEATPL